MNNENKTWHELRWQNLSITNLKSVYISTWFKTGTMIIISIMAISSVLVNEIQFVSTAAWNWDGSTVKVSVHTIPTLILRVPIFWTELSV